MGRALCRRAGLDHRRHLPGDPLQGEARKAEGCLAVDMEVAGVQAVCSFHGFQLYCFLMTGDVLDLPEWDVAELGEANHSMDNLKLALKLAAAV